MHGVTTSFTPAKISNGKTSKDRGVSDGSIVSNERGAVFAHVGLSSAPRKNIYKFCTHSQAYSYIS